MTEADGGCLRCHVGAAAGDDECAGEGCTHVDVQPQAGRLVLFRSDALLHEVLPAHALRFAVSLWILEAAAEGAEGAE